MPDEPTPPPQPILRATHGRDVDLRRDALTGTPAEQERHRVARTCLLQLLYDRHLDAIHGTRDEGPLGAINAEAITAYEALATAMDLPNRGAVWQDDRCRARREAIFLAWAEAMLVLPKMEMVALARTLAARLQVPVLWLGLELQEIFKFAMVGYTLGRDLRYGFERDMVDLTFSLRVQPGESEAAFLERARVARAQVMGPAASGRMPKDHEYIRQNVVWLARHRLDDIFIGQLAREYAATKPNLRDEGRKTVRDGIQRAHEWLNAVAPEAKVLPTASGPNVIGPAPELEALPPLVREMAERLPATPETVAGLKRAMRRVAQGPRSKKTTSKTKAARAQRKRNRRR